MERYRVVVGVVENGMAGVPWLAGARPIDPASGKGKGKGQGKGGKGKMIEKKDKTEGGRRGVVAKAVVDVVQFREEVWRRRIMGGGRVEFDMEEEGEEGENGDELDLGLEEEGKENGGTGVSAQAVEDDESAPTPTRKRR